MMSKTLRDLQAGTKYRKFSSEQDLDEFLREKFPRADATERISMKISLAAAQKFSLTAAGELRTDEVLEFDRLASDLPRHRYQPETSPVSAEMTRLLRRAGLSLDRSYSDAEVSSALEVAQIGVMERIAVKHLMAERGCLRR
jgi:hypothetical protein